MEDTVPTADLLWRRRRVFITGATGLVGAWLTERLLHVEADVVALVRDGVPGSNFHRLGLDSRVVTVRGELEDYLLMERILNEYEIEVIFHLGAQAIVGIANQNPLSTFSANIQGTWNVLEAARHARHVKAVVQASSDKAYGTHDLLPYTEESSLTGRHPYDVSKSCADLIAQSYWFTYQLPVAITRCGNFYGGGDLNFNRIVPGTIRSLIDGQRPIIRSDGTLIRDYFYVKDGVGAYMVTAERLLAGEAAGEAYNFSNEIQVNVRELVEMICRVAGVAHLEPLVLNDAPHEIPHQYLSAEKARRTLGWKPRYTLEEGLRETVGWYRQYFAEQALGGNAAFASKEQQG
jgi:CDP-glucose 4,6-dehydratase